MSFFIYLFFYNFSWADTLKFRLLLPKLIQLKAICYKWIYSEKDLQNLNVEVIASSKTCLKYLFIYFNDGTRFVLTLIKLQKPSMVLNRISVALYKLNYPDLSSLDLIWQIVLLKKKTWRKSFAFNENK